VTVRGAGGRRSRLPPRLLPAAALLILAATVSSCSRQESPPPPEATGPIGRAAYDRLLQERSGSRLTAERLGALAEEVYRQVEARLDALAVAETGERDWRPMFAELERDHPRDPDSVLAAYRAEVGRAAAFVRERRLVTLPPGLPEVVEVRGTVFRRTFPLAVYLDGRLGVTTGPPRPDSFPGRYLRHHCAVCIPPLAVHETYPGHHVAFFHADHPEEPPPTALAAEVKANRRNWFFHEGWGQYAEVLMLEQGYYVDPARRLGAGRLLLLRALRARVDAGLHSRTLTPGEAIDLYRSRLLYDEAAARTEVRRHLEDPTEKATYLVGLLQVLELREKAMEADASLDLRTFHDRLLRWPLPIPEVARATFGVTLDGDGSRGLELLEELLAGLSGPGPHPADP
jgi:uncharacterized protein (DUF885 family)